MVKLYTIFSYRPMNIQQVSADVENYIQKYGSKPERFTIDEIIELPKTKFESLKKFLYKNRDFLTGKEGVLLVKQKGKSNESGIIIRPAGYSYARYVGLPIEKI